MRFQNGLGIIQKRFSNISGGIRGSPDRKCPVTHDRITVARYVPGISVLDQCRLLPIHLLGQKQCCHHRTHPARLCFLLPVGLINRFDISPFKKSYDAFVFFHRSGVRIKVRKVGCGHHEDVTPPDHFCEGRRQDLSIPKILPSYIDGHDLKLRDRFLKERNLHFQGMLLKITRRIFIQQRAFSADRFNDRCIYRNFPKRCFIKINIVH